MRLQLETDLPYHAVPADADLLDALEADFWAAESSGRLAQTVQSNRRQVMKAA